MTVALSTRNPGSVCILYPVCSLQSDFVLTEFLSRFVLLSRNVHRQQPERSEIFIFCGLSLSGLSLARFKIRADILIAFAGEFFCQRNRRQSRYNVVNVNVNVNALFTLGL